MQLLVLVLACTKHPSHDAVARDGSLPWDPGVARGTLANGLQWFVERAEYPAGRAELRLVVDAGAALETPEQYGAAHILEHLAFQGGAHFGPDELVAFMESIGMRFGPDANAGTTMQSTVYELRVPSEPAVIERGFDWFQDIAGSLTLGEEQLEHEKKVVLEEWRRQQSAWSRLQIATNMRLFAGTVYATHLTIGDEQSIRAMTRESIEAFWQTWYRPESMAVVVAGDVDVAAIAALVERDMASLPTRGRERDPIVPAVTEGAPTALVFRDPELTQVDLTIEKATADREEPTFAHYRESLARNVILGVVGERLEDLMVDKESPLVGADAFRVRVDAATQVSGLETRVKDGRVSDAIAVLLQERERAARYPPTWPERQRAAKRFLSRMDQAVASAETEDPADRVDELIRHFLLGESVPGLALEAKMAHAWLPDLTSKELLAAARELFGGDGWFALLSAPESAEIVDEEELRRALESAPSWRVSKPRDLPPPPPLVPERPVPGAIVGTREIVELGATEWTLGNGARVMVRPSAVEPDEVLFQAMSRGGFAGEGIDALVPGTTAVPIAARSGVGALDNRDLGRVLNGTNFSLGPYLGRSYEGFTGRTVPADLEVFLQLLHERVVHPRFTDAAFSSEKLERTTYLSQRLSDPDEVADDALDRALYGDDPWRRPWTVEDLERMDLDRSKAIYATRFGNVGDWTFLIAGAVDLERLRPLVETWLASLPGTPGFQEPAGDDGVRPVRGVKEVVVRAGIAPRARVRLVFSGPWVSSAQERVLLTGMVDVLGVELRRALREKEAGVYGVSAEPSIWTQPWSGYRVEVAFTCDPARVDQLVDAVRSVIASLRSAPLENGTIADVRAARLEGFETDVVTNRWWLSTMEHVVDDGDPPDLAATYPARVAALTPASIHAAAERYLDLGNYVLVKQLPAE
jgi:zinc protease